MITTRNKVDTPWGILRLGDTIIVSTSQKKTTKSWILGVNTKDAETPPLKHLGTFIGLLRVKSERTTDAIYYPHLQDYVMIETIPGVRTQIPFSNIDSIV